MPTIRCLQCTYMTHKAQELDKHMFHKHSHGTLCLQCGVQSGTFKEYEEHMDIHVLDCEECEKPFHGLRGLRRHKLKVHMPEMRTTCKGMSNVAEPHLKKLIKCTCKNIP